MEAVKQVYLKQTTGRLDELFEYFHDHMLRGQRELLGRVESNIMIGVEQLGPNKAQEYREKLE